MKISSILLTESRQYLYEGLSTKDKNTMFLWESAGVKLVEAELNPEQIKQLFAAIEQDVTASGANRTIVGKGKDALSAVNKAWEDLKTKAQNSGPIKNMDAMYDQAAEKLKQATGGDQGVMKYVQKYRDFAKKHPIAQSLIYSALIAAAGISGAGLGGAAALGLFKMTDKLLQGEKFSSAAYSGAKTGATAYAAGQIGQQFKGQPTGGAGAPEGVPTASGDIPMDAPAAGAPAGSAPSADTPVQYNQNATSVVPDRAPSADAGSSWMDNTDAEPGGAGASDVPTDAGDGSADLGKEFRRQADNQIKLNQMMQQQVDAQQAADAADQAAGLGGQVDQAPAVTEPASAPSTASTNPDYAPGDAAASAAAQPPKGAAMSPEYLQKVISGEQARPMISPEEAQKALDWQSQNGGQITSAATDAAKGAGKGFSKEYLQSVIDGDTPRPLISKERAQELLDKIQGSERADELISKIQGAAGDQGFNVQLPGGSVHFANQAAYDAWQQNPASVVQQNIGGQTTYSLPNNLKEAKILAIFAALEEDMLAEGILDKIKGAAGKGLQWAQTQGRNLTTKITADKLEKAWKSAGSPKDSNAISKILQGAGVSPDAIQRVYANMKIGSASVPAVAGPSAQVGTPSATGGDTFSSPGVTTHKAAPGREQMQQQARAEIEKQKQARAAAQQPAAAKALPPKAPAALPAPAPQGEPETPGFLQSKIKKGGYVAPKTAMAEDIRRMLEIAGLRPR